MSAGMATKVSSRQDSLSLKKKGPKKFPGKNKTLFLAAAISYEQEEKVQLKIDRNHRLQAAQPGQPGQPQQIPKTVFKSKLKRTKDMLVAQRMQAKRDKVRSRKQRLQGDVEYQEGSRDGQPVNTAHKKVVQSAAVLTRGGY